METVRSIKDACRKVEEALFAGKKIGFVPTMGALHKAHAELFRQAGKDNDFTVVSIFVNPTQFGPGEDYESYPRMIEEDSKLCEELGVDLLFVPDISEMYRENNTTYVHVDSLTETMCGRCRPGHFRGVATVVSKLFNIIKPHSVYLGQKDYQQFKVIERMVHDLNYNLELIMCQTIREDDGLAVSSRNKYLTKEQRANAVWIYRALSEGGRLVCAGGSSPEEISSIMRKTIENNIDGSEIDYCGIFDAESLKAVTAVRGGIVLAAAVRIGKARLIDNIVVKPGSDV
jgi:pantoate--beta-alanine ligase